MALGWLPGVTPTPRASRASPGGFRTGGGGAAGCRTTPAPPPLRREDDFAGVGAVDHGGGAGCRVRQREDLVDEGAGAGLLAEAQEPAELVAGAHSGADDRQLGEEDPGELGGPDVAAGGAGDDDPAAGLERADRVRPGGLADGLHHDVDPLGQPGAGGERLVGAELERRLAFGLAPARHPDAVAGRAPEQDQGGGDAAAGPLDEDRRAG